MRKRFITLLAACCLLAALSTSACALEYTFDSPATGDFGTPTSADDTIREQENPNTDKSKNSALIPPGFGTPTSYLPGSGEFLTPNLAAGGPLNSPSLMASAGGANTSGGAVVLPGPVGSVSGTPPTFAASNSGSGTGTASTSGGYTEVTEDSYYSNGSLGTLKIPAIDLTVKIYQGTGSDTLKKGAGHFTNTSIWNGNVSLAAHNRGANSYFGEIHTLENGDRITLTTKEGTRTYAVTSIAKIGETDNSMLESTSENCITLFTCVRDQREYRWCVRAVEI
ncbi:MAG: sortase [Oscillibacter sp.]|nr:sortase [Oscillibacter sp.]